eukprot:g24335.t1
MSPHRGPRHSFLHRAWVCLAGFSLGVLELLSKRCGLNHAKWWRKRIIPVLMEENVTHWPGPLQDLEGVVHRGDSGGELRDTFTLVDVALDVAAYLGSGIGAIIGGLGMYLKKMKDEVIQHGTCASECGLGRSARMEFFDDCAQDTSMCEDVDFLLRLKEVYQHRVGLKRDEEAPMA